MNGSNKLLCNGEICVTRASDVLKYYPEIKFEKDEFNCSNNAIIVPNELKEIYEVLTSSKMSVDEVCSRVSDDISIVLSKLMLLELQGYVIQYPGKMFSKSYDR